MLGWIFAVTVAGTAVYSWTRWQQLARAEFIRNYAFPHGLFEKLRVRRPSLETRTCSSWRVPCDSSFSRI